MTQAVRSPSPQKAAPPMDRQDDPFALLLERVAKQQDLQAFEQIFKHFGPQLKGFARVNGIAKLGEHFPDELVQEVMTSVWRKAHQYDRSKANASTWIFTIARNQRIDMLRRTNRQRFEVSSEDVWVEPEVDGPIVDVQRKATERLIRAQMMNLPEEQREVIGKVYMEEKSHQDVATELGIPLGTVKSRVRLALGKLKLMLEPMQ